jgi:hypothetical protein
MKTYRPWFYALTCIVVAVICYLWATQLMDSLYDYRSPLKASPPAPGPALGSPATRRLLLVHIDGLRADVAADPQQMPFLNELRQRGASATMHSRPPTYSHPAYTTLFTGAWPDLSDGPAMNLDDPQTISLWTQDNLFAAARRAGLKVAVADYRLFDRFLPPGALDASFYSQVLDLQSDEGVVAAALPWLKSGAYSLVLVHLSQVDEASHFSGPFSEAGRQAEAENDRYLRQIVDQLDLQKDTVIVFSDHGHLDAGGHGGTEAIVMQQPFVMTGAAVKPGEYGDIQMVDLAPTAAALLGLNIPAASQGGILTQMLTLTPAQQDAIWAASGQQQAALLAAYGKAIGQPVQLARVRTVPQWQAALDATREARLNAERLPRYILAALVLALGLYLIWSNRSAGLAWNLAGAVIYLLLFNLRYGVTAGRTYTLSSVASADELIRFIAVTAGLAYALAWLIVALRRDWLKERPAQAAAEVFRLTFVTLFVVGMPALWAFAWNGALVTWTLPDMNSMFMGFLAILQMLVIATLGLGLALVTAGIAAGLRRLVNRPA